MDSSKYIFTLDLRSVQSQITLPVTQGDTNRTLLISFSDGAKPYVLGENSVAMISIVRPTGTKVQEVCLVEEGGACVIYHFSDHTCAVPGLHNCQMVLYNPEGKQIASPKFSIDAAPRLVDGDDVVLPDEDITAIDEIFRNEAARQAAELKRETAENARESAEKQREIDTKAAIREVNVVKANIEFLRDSGGFDGVSPSVRVVDTSTGHRVIITDKNGDKTIDVNDGEKGANGVSAFHEWNGTTLTMRSAAGTSSADLKGEKGDKGDKGDGIQIYRTFPSIAEMLTNYATDGVPVGAFVLISTENIDDPDNSRLYVKTETTYQYLNDLSGAQGIQGPKGDPGEKGDSVYHRWDGTNLIIQSASGTSSSNLKGEKGDPGEAADVSKLVPNMSQMDEMMFEKFGTGDKEYFFSQANWDDLQRYNRAYVQCYDDENDLRLGEDGKGLYALRAICRFGVGTVPRYPWMKKSDWVAKYRENNPQTELTDEEIIINHPPKDTDFEYMATLVERQPNGFIKVPTGFPTDKTVAQMEGYAVPKKYADSIKDIALGAVQKIDCPDKNRYVYTATMNSKGESIVSLIKMGANPTADVNQPLIRRRVNGAVSTRKIPEAADDAASKYYVDNRVSSIPKFNIEVVSELPTGENVSFTTVYLLRGDGGTGNLYEEYICVQPPGLSGAVWEKLGTANVDLAGYAKTSDLTSGNLIVKTANVATEATYALYASIDRTKGTIEERLTASSLLSSMGGATVSTTSNFIGTKSIENVPNGRTYLVIVKIFGTTYPKVYTFPIYLPPYNDESGKFQTDHILSPNVKNDAVDHIHIDGTSSGAAEAYSSVRFSAFFNDASQITKIVYTIL